MSEPEPYPELQKQLGTPGPKYIPERMPDRLPKGMSDRMPE